MTLRKILIITYYWPPYAGSGVQRWLKFTKYLPDFGFKPYVYTPENPHFNISDQGLLKDVHDEVVEIKRPIWEPYSIADMITGKKTGNKGLVSSKKSGFKSSILGKIRANFFIPDPRKFWVRPSVKFLKDYIREEGIEYVISTGPPHSMHLIAKELKEAIKELKWVADIRDPWSKFDFLKNFGSSDRSLRKQADLERSVLESCDGVIATSEQMKDLLVDFDHAKFDCITNGYDSEDFEDFRDNTSPDKLVMYHAGLLNELRNPSSLWEALNSICERNSTIADRLNIHLVGTIDDGVIDEIQSYYHLKDRLTVEKYKSHDEVISDYSKSDILLLLVNNSDNARANIPGKLFEYLATGKRILAFTERGTDASNILMKSELSLQFDYEADKTTIESSLNAFLLPSNEMPSGHADLKTAYERKNLTSNLVNLLLEL